MEILLSQLDVLDLMVFLGVVAQLPVGTQMKFGIQSPRSVALFSVLILCLNCFDYYICVFQSSTSAIPDRLRFETLLKYQAFVVRSQIQFKALKCVFHSGYGSAARKAAVSVHVGVGNLRSVF